MALWRCPKISVVAALSLLVACTPCAARHDESLATGEVARQPVALLFLKFNGDQVEVAGVERSDGFLPITHGLPQASELYLEVRDQGGNLLHASGLIDPRQVHCDTVDPSTGQLTGGIEIRDEILLPVPVPDLPEARRLAVKRRRPALAGAPRMESAPLEDPSLLDTAFPTGGGR